MDTFLPPKYSLNSFFVRHVAVPKRMKVIHGLNNVQICSVNDDMPANSTNFPSIVSGRKSMPSFPPNNYNENLAKSSIANDKLASSSMLDLSSTKLPNAVPKRRERAQPYQGMWGTFGLIDDTDKWRSELNSLAASVGLVTPQDIENYKRRKEREEMLRNMEERDKVRKGTAASVQSRQGTQNGPKVATRGATGRLNEPLLAGRRTRGSRGTRGGTMTGQKYVVNQQERDAWMLQVLCQILQTDKLVDVQSWLVSASVADKERVKAMIDQAMKGLEEAGRIEVDQESGSAENSSTLNEIENKIQQINLEGSQSRLNSMASNNGSRGIHSSANRVADILKIEDDPGRPLEPINEEDGGSEKDTSPRVLHINMNRKSKRAQNKPSPLDNTVIKLETPRGDLKIEQVKVTFLVKDNDSDVVQEIVGDWAPNNTASSENNNTSN